MNNFEKEIQQLTEYYRGGRPETVKTGDQLKAANRYFKTSDGKTLDDIMYQANEIFESFFNDIVGEEGRTVAKSKTAALVDQFADALHDMFSKSV